MEPGLRRRLDELYASGERFDAGQNDRRDRRRNLEPDTAELLAMLVRVAGARRVVEIGTSNGYSTIWLGDAVRDTAGHVDTVDTGEWAGLRDNLASSGVDSFVTVHVADGGEYLAEVADGSVDVLFLDAERVEYPRWWPDPLRVLRPGGLLAVDNVLSHPDEVAEFLALVESARVELTTVRVGKGLALAWVRGH